MDEVKRQHQEDLLQQRQLHLYQLKALEGQLLENLITQVSDSKESLNEALKEEILKSVKETIDKSPSNKRSSLPTAGTYKTHDTTCPPNVEGSRQVAYSPCANHESKTDDSCETTQRNALNLSLTYSPVNSPPFVKDTTASGGIRRERIPLSPRNYLSDCRENNEIMNLVPNVKQFTVGRENEILADLEMMKKIEKYEEVIAMQEEKLRKSQLQLQRYEETQSSQDKLNVTLQSRVVSLTKQIKDQEKLIDDLNVCVSDLKRECQFMSEEKFSMKEKLDEKFIEIKYLHEENYKLKNNIETLNEQLLDTQNELTQLQSLYSRHQYTEDQYRSIIDQLELEIKSLRLKLQKQDDVHVSFELPLHPSFQEQSFKQYEERPSTTPTNQFKTPAANFKSQPLTRRKWLETSEGAFQFGTPNVPPGNRDLNKPSVPRHSLSKDFKMSTFSSLPAAADDVLEAVRNKSITSSPNKKNKRKSIEERVEERLKKVREAEGRLVQLQHDKERLESFLQRAPPSHKVTADLKQRKREAESKLDEVLKEIGSVRMIIRNSTTKKK